jgi:predicted GTPase
MEDLQASVRAVDCDVVLVGTPFDLARRLDVGKPMLRVRYSIEDLPSEPGAPTLAEAVITRLAARSAE